MESDYAGKTIQLDLVVFPADDKSFIDWRGLALTNERPGLRTIFEDDPGFAAQLNRGTGQIEMISDKPYSGAASLKVTPDAGDNPQLPGLDVAIVDQPRMGQYRHVMFAWKQPTGTQMVVQFANDGRFADEFAQAGRRLDGFQRASMSRGRIQLRRFAR